MISNLPKANVLSFLTTYIFIDIRQFFFLLIVNIVSKFDTKVSVAAVLENILKYISSSLMDRVGGLFSLINL